MISSPATSAIATASAGYGARFRQNPIHTTTTTGRYRQHGLKLFANDNRWLEQPAPHPAFSHAFPIGWGTGQGEAFEGFGRCSLRNYLKAVSAWSSKAAAVRLRMAGAVAKLRDAFKVEVPVGYQDENGFHYGVQPVEMKINWPPAG